MSRDLALTPRLKPHSDGLHDPNAALRISAMEQPSVADFGSGEEDQICASLVDELQGILVEDSPWAFGPGAKNRARGENRAEGENKAEGQNQDSSAAPQSGGDKATEGNTAASADTSGPSRDPKKIDKGVDLSGFNGKCSRVAV